VTKPRAKDATAISETHAETVGSLLRPASLLEVRRQGRQGEVDLATVRAAEDAAVLEAIALQESTGLDVITDGEMRRGSWIATARGPIDGFEVLPGGPGWQWQGTDQAGRWSNMPFPFVTRKIQPLQDLAETEYAYLEEHAHRRTKYCIPAPSYHRTLWHPEHSRAAYPSCDDFLLAMRAYIRSVVEHVVAMGCDYVQLDAPNYGNLCDPRIRAMLTQHGQNLDRELPFDAELDSSVFEGLSGVTRAMHICRGNAAGNWAASGGYERIAADLFPRLSLDRLLLEYDTPRSGDFGPLQHVPETTTVVLGLLTTKTGAPEQADAVEQRINEAARVLPLERLALSPQCGFASVEIGNPLTRDQQDAKLRTVVQVARRVWPRQPVPRSA